jgi:hypothetical protein
LWKPKGEDWKPKQGNTGLQALYQLEKDVKAERESRRNLLSQLMVKQRILTVFICGGGVVVAIIAVLIALSE